MGLERMSDRILNVGDVLVINLPKRLESGLLTSLCFFFRVGAAWPLLIEYDKLPEIEGKTGTDWFYLGEDGPSEGKDILRIERDDFHVYHTFLVPENPYLRIYKTISPVGHVLSALDRKSTTDLPDPKNGRNIDRDYYNLIAAGGDVFNPNSLAEQIIFKTNRGAGQSFKWALYNPLSETVKTKLIVTGAGYKLIPICKRDVMEKILALSLVRVRDVRAARILRVSLGDIRSEFEVVDFIPDKWLEAGNYLTLDENLAQRIDTETVSRTISALR